jgi:leucyl-tRNA synthetase
LKATEYAEANGFGTAKINFRLRDAIFGRQRYWGEPIPIYYKESVPHLVEDDKLPLELPSINEYLPTEDGDPPLGRAKDWNHDGHPYELSTMPGWAGSSWYFFRYMDPRNDTEFASKEAMDYWQDVDFYLGGSEHATGHLLYARFWTKFLYDRGYVKVEEFAKKLVNQGMIQGVSKLVYRIDFKPQLIGGQSFDSNDETLMEIISDQFYHTQNQISIICSVEYRNKFFHGELSKADLIKHAKSKSAKIQKVLDKYHTEINIESVQLTPIHIDVNMVNGDLLDPSELKGWRPEFNESIFLFEGELLRCGSEVEKMSKRWYNVVNPDDLVEKYGADTLRMYEMFLGPIEQSKPWNTNGIEGVFKFLRKYWNLFHTKDTFTLSEEAATKPELKILHTLLKKVEQDCESLSLNTSVSAFMIAVNELGAFGCNKRAILEPMTIALSPFAPHIAEELWHLMGHANSVVDAPFPQWDEKHLVEESFEYPISINGKVRTKLSFAVDMTPAEIEKAVLADETVLKWTEGQAPKKVIVVPRRIVNVVL